MTQKMLTGVFGLAFDGKDRFLLTQRIDHENEGAHMLWQIPGGGMEFGELPEETLIRELQEEIKCTPTTLLDRPIVRVSVWPGNNGEDIEYHVTLITYLVSIGNQVPKTTDESFDCVWYTLQDLEKIQMLPNVKETVSAFAAVLL